MPDANPRKLFQHAAFHGEIGVARCDFTPPVGVYNRLWGAATSDTATGVHRPIGIKALALREATGQPPLVFLSLDICLIRDPEDSLFRNKLIRALELGDPSRLIIQCTHTHGSVPFSLSLKDKPGADLLVAWCRELMEKAIDVAREAISLCQNAELTWEEGVCNLASQRDFPQPGVERKFACGFNPDVVPDRTLLVGRVHSRQSGKTLAVLTHYACHPTTLAFQNSLLSPDFIGAADELIHQHCQCPLIFIQGASGELAPRQQYTGDPAVADQNGRVLGFAALSILENMLPPFQTYQYEGMISSGADLGFWQSRPRLALSTGLRACQTWVDLPLVDRPSLKELKQKLRDETDPPIRERLERHILREEHLDGADFLRAPVFFWQVGDSYWIAQSQETYSLFQRELRRAFPGITLLPMNVANGPHISYIYPAGLADLEIYQVEVSLFAPQTLDLLLRHCQRELRTFMEAAPTQP